MVFYRFFMVFYGFFKELDFKELEIHRYSLLDTINEYQWKSINEYQWISINEFIDGPSMNMVFFLWAFLWALLWASIGPPLGPPGFVGSPRTMRGDSLELWPGLVLHGVEGVDFHVFWKYWNLTSSPNTSKFVFGPPGRSSDFLKS